MANLIVEDVSFETEIREPRDAKLMKQQVQQKIEADKRLTDREIAWAARASPRLFTQVRDHVGSGSDYRRRKEKVIQKYTDETESDDE